MLMSWPWKWRSVAAAAAIAVSLFSGAAAAVAAESQPAEAEALPAVGSRFILNTHDGRTVTDEDFRGRHLLVFFGYTHCPDICPSSLLTVARVLELLGDQAKHVQPLFITVDPARDTRQVLSEFVPHFDARIVGLTGNEQMIERVAKGYRAKYARVDGRDGTYSVDHTATLFHMGPAGEYIGRFPYETTAEKIAEDLRASLKASVGSNTQTDDRASVKQ